jgi:uncharacterized protein (TIGR02246 family)
MRMGDSEGAARPGRGADDAAIRALIERQVSSWNRCDPAGYAAAYTEDGDCVSFLGAHYRGRDAIAASCEVPRATSLFRKLNRNARLTVEVTQLRFVTSDVAVIHATGGVGRGARCARRNLRTNTCIAVRTDQGWLLAASHNTTRRPTAERLVRRLLA